MYGEEGKRLLPIKKLEDQGLCREVVSQFYLRSFLDIGEHAGRLLFYSFALSCNMAHQAAVGR